MPKFSLESSTKLSTCHPSLIKLANLAIQYADFSIITGHRGQVEQHAAFVSGLSKLDWPQGNHNAIPSTAFDFAPYPIDWKEGELPHARFTFVAGILWECSINLNIKIRFGWDWNRNLDPRDESFLDWGHVELI